MTAKSTSAAPLWRKILRRTLGTTLLVVVVAAASLFYLGAYVLSAPTYKGPKSDHFDGERFYNHIEVEGRFSDLLRWQLNRDAGIWDDWTESEPGEPPPERVSDGDLRVTFVNHSTVLVQMDGVNVLTDPVWSHRVSPLSWVGPSRKRPPGIRFEDLPQIDLVLLSHNHYDHLDVPTLKRLSNEHHPLVLTGLGNTQFLESEGIGHAQDLDWMESVDVGRGVKVTSVPVQHFSGRGFRDRNGTLWCGFVIEGPSGRIYFAGDTGYGRHFVEAREAFGPIRLALLPIGAYRPEWFMSPVHTSPAESVQAHLDLEAGTSVAIHFGTFRLADDGQTEPVDDLRLALEAEPIGLTRFWVLDHGEGRNVPRL